MDRVFILQSHFFRCSALLGFLILAEGLATAQLLPTLTNVTTVASTVPANGDVNPYGVAQVPKTQGKLVEGNILVSNFNNSSNQQGTGSTIVQVSPTGALFGVLVVSDRVFFADDATNTLNVAEP